MASGSVDKTLQRVESARFYRVAVVVSAVWGAGILAAALVGFLARSFDGLSNLGWPPYALAAGVTGLGTSLLLMRHFEHIDATLPTVLAAVAPDPQREYELQESLDQMGKSLRSAERDKQLLKIEVASLRDPARLRLATLKRCEAAGRALLKRCAPDPEWEPPTSLYVVRDAWIDETKAAMDGLGSFRAVFVQEPTYSPSASFMYSHVQERLDTLRDAISYLEGKRGGSSGYDDFGQEPF